jgi:MFS family permease
MAPSMPEDAPAPAERPLWANRDFTVFWSVQTLSELGNAFALVALPLLVLHATGSVAQMGLLTGIAGVGSICTGLVSGAITDRFDRRMLLMLCDGARLVLYGGIPVCWAIRPQVWVLYVVMALASVFEMVFKTTYVAAVANLTTRAHIVQANGRLESTNALAFIVGPTLAGLVSGLFGPTTAIAVDAGSFGVSLLGLAVIRFRPAERHRAAGWTELRRGFVTGVAFLWRTPVLRYLTLLLTVITFLSLGMNDVFIYEVRHVLGHGDRTVGYVVGVAGAGTVVGAVLTPALRRMLGFGRCWLSSYVVCGAAAAAAGLAGSVAALAPAVFLYSFGMALAGICSMSLRQELTPDHLLGRVTSAFWTLHGALGPIGAAVLTLLVQHHGVRGPLLGTGAVFLLVVVAGHFTPIRQTEPGRDAPCEPPGEEAVDVEPGPGVHSGGEP